MELKSVYLVYDLNELARFYTDNLSYLIDLLDSEASILNKTPILDTPWNRMLLQVLQNFKLK